MTGSTETHRKTELRALNERHKKKKKMQRQISKGKTKDSLS